MTIQNKVLKIFERLNIGKPELNASMASDLGMDSQEIVTLIIELEKEFNVQLNLTGITRDMTVSEVIDFVETKTKEPV